MLQRASGQRQGYLDIHLSFIFNLYYVSPGHVTCKYPCHLYFNDQASLLPYQSDSSKCVSSFPSVQAPLLHSDFSAASHLPASHRFNVRQLYHITTTNTYKLTSWTLELVDSTSLVKDLRFLKYSAIITTTPQADMPNDKGNGTPASTTSGAKTSFLDLPSEIRCLIYGHIFSDIEDEQSRKRLIERMTFRNKQKLHLTLKRKLEKKTRKYPLSAIPTTWIGILCVSSLIYAEAKHVLYNRRFNLCLNQTRIGALNQVVRLFRDSNPCCKILSTIEQLDITVLVEFGYIWNYAFVDVPSLLARYGQVRSCSLTIRTVFMPETAPTFYGSVLASKESESTTDVLSLYSWGSWILGLVQRFRDLPIDSTPTLVWTNRELEVTHTFALHGVFEVEI